MNTQNGYFILADISGFTSFVAGSELEHSQFILKDLLNLIVNKFTPVFSLAEVEGDAVFVYAPVEKFQRSEIIIEVIESLYFLFRDTKATFLRMTTCTCKACEMIQTLDLKFIVHRGEFVMNDVAGKFKPLGSPVNAAHRLLKNKVTEVTGWKSYILFTKECLNHMGMELSGSHQQVENYEHLGDIETVSINLGEEYNKYIADRRSFLTKDNADFSIEKIFDVPVPVLWDWINNPKKRSQWIEISDWKVRERPGGRTGKGAVNHCVNSDFLEKLLDYRPFDYYTSELSKNKFNYTITGKFESTPEGTKFLWLMKINNSLPKWIRKNICKFFFMKILKMNASMEKLRFLIKEEMQN